MLELPGFEVSGSRLTIFFGMGRGFGLKALGLDYKNGNTHLGLGFRGEGFD